MNLVEGLQKNWVNARRQFPAKPVEAVVTLGFLCKCGHQYCRLAGGAVFQFIDVNQDRFPKSAVACMSTVFLKRPVTSGDHGFHYVPVGHRIQIVAALIGHHKGD